MISETLVEKFGLKKFREPQEKIIKGALKNYDQLVILPTGTGKSLCYQLAAVLGEGSTIVISPLKSLIHDQVQGLKKKNISCIVISGESNKIELNLKRRELEEGIYKLIYTTPETMAKNIIMVEILNELNKRGKLDRFVIDEAHCISSWGNDFRSNYRDLGELRRIYKNIPIMGLTATATKKVRLDIVKTLRFKEYREYSKSYFRSNLKIDIKEKGKNSYREILKKIRSTEKGSGIIYCLSRKKCDNLAEKLINDGIKAESYHAGLGDKRRLEIESNWFEGKTTVIVATIAFGMGIDKKDVRYVIHNNMPSSIENYYQEIGRGGRDGMISHCILYYNYSDVIVWDKIIESSIGSKIYKEHKRENIKKMFNYCENSIDCRHEQLCEYLGDDNIIKDCGGSCDNCKNEKELLDVTEIAKIILNTIINLGEEGNKKDIDLSAKRTITYKKITIEDKNYRRVFIYLLRNKYIKEIINTKCESSLWKEKYKLFKKARDILEDKEKMKITVSVSKKDWWDWD